MKHKQCPACQSLKTTVATGKFSRSELQAFKNRTCNECGTIWRPASPRWIGILLIVFGIAVMVIESAVAYGIVDVNNKINAMGKLGQAQPHNVGSRVVFFFGFAGVFYGVMALLGQTGKMKILGKLERDTKE